MNHDDFLCTRISQITESVIRKDWGRAYELIEEWEADDRLSTRKQLDQDDWHELGLAE